MENSKTIVTEEQLKKIAKYKWIVWTILALTYIFVTFHRLSPAAVKTDLQTAFGVGAKEYATIGSMYFWSYFIMQIPSGILADKIGPKKTVTMFTIIAAIGSIIFGLSSSIYAAYFGRFLVGLGVSVVFICLIKIQSKWFSSKNFAFMIGMVGLAANLGAVMAQTPLLVAAKSFGWRKTFIFLGILMFFFTALTFFFVKDDPKDMGLPSMDEVENRKVQASNINVKEALLSVLKNKRTWTVSIGYIGLYVGYIVFLGTFGMSLLMNRYGITNKVAGNYIIVAIVGAALSGLVIGGLSDKLKKRRMPIAVCSVLTLIGWIILVYVKLPEVILLPFLFLFGFVISAFTLSWTIGNEVNDRRLSGISTGVVNCIGFLGAAIVPIFMGNVLDKYKADPTTGMTKAFLILIIVTAVSTVFNFFVTETNATNVYEENK